MSSHRSITSTLIEVITTTYWMEYSVTDLFVDTSKRFPLTFCLLVDTETQTNIQSVRICGSRRNSRHYSTYGISSANQRQNTRDTTNRSYGSQTFPSILWISWTTMIMLACRISRPSSSLGSMTIMDKTLHSKRGGLNTPEETFVVQ